MQTRLHSELVHDARAAVTAVLRLAGLVLVCWGVIQVGTRLLFGVLGNGSIGDAWGVWLDYGSTHGVFRGAPVLAVGVGLCVLSRPMARWIVRPPDQSCPRCAHERPHAEASAPSEDDTDVCTECGYRLAA